MKFRSLVSSISAAILMAPSILSAAPFTAGNLVVVRVGDGSAALSNAATATFLTEITTAGSVVQSIALPTAASIGVNSCALGGTATTEGYLTLSSDGQYLVGGCYSSALGTATPSGVAPATAPRTIFRADGAGVIDTTTAIATTTASGAIRGVASSNGNDLWFGTGGGGSFQTTLGGTTATQLYTTLNNSRNVQIANGQLYGSTASTTFRLFTIGTGLPTATGQTITQLNGIPTAGISPAAFYFADLSVAEPGLDTVYLTDDTTGTGGIRKFSLVAGIWTLNGVIDSGSTNNRGLTGSVSGGVVTLFSTRVNTLTTVTDSAGHNVAPSTTAVSTITTAATNTAFRGVAFVPAPAQPNLTIAAAQGTEGDSPGCGNTPLNFTVTSSSAAPIGGINFTFSTADGTATLADNDYTQVTAGAGTIAAGNTTGTATVNITCDKNAEANETFSVNLIDGASYNLGAPATASGTINDDDTPVLSVADVSLTEGNGGTSNLSFTVQLDRPAPTGGVSYNYVTADIDAISGSDYVASGTLAGSIAAGTASQQHTVTINGDTTVEANETFSFTVSAATPVAAAGNDFVATGTIQNDDVSALPTISINDVSIAEGNSGTSTLTFNVTLSAPAPAGGVTFDIATSDGTATDADNDYEPRSLTGQTIIAGNSSYSFDVTVNGDSAAEPNELFSVTIANTTNVVVIGSDLTGQGTIANDDIVISVQPTASVTEGNSGTSNASVTISASSIPSGTVTVDYTTTGVSALSGTDFTATSGTATIACAVGPALPCNATVNVPIVGDLVNEADETLTLTLSNLSGTNVSLGNSTSTITISNDDVAAIEIWQIQGDGSRSPNEGQTVSTIGNVVTAKFSNSFMMQTPDNRADADFETSNAVLVFTGTSSPVLAAMNVGDVIDVRGQVIEFASTTTSFGVTRTKFITEFTSAGLVLVRTPGPVPVPSPIALGQLIPSPDGNVPTCDPDNNLNANDPIDGSFDIDSGTPVVPDDVIVRNFECLEGMRVTTSNGIIGGPNQTFGSDPYAEMTFTANGLRPFREPGLSTLVANENVSAINVTPPAPPLPLGVVWDSNPDAFEIDVDKFQPGHPDNVLVPGTMFAATGIIGIDFADYELYVQTLNVTAAAPALPTAVPTPATTQLTVASLNVLRLFDYCDDPGTPASNEPVNIADTDRKIAKLSVYIRQVLRAPDVIGIQETEIPSVPATVCVNGQVTTSALQLLANKITADGGPTYAVYNSPATHDPGRISVAFLVNAARVTVNATTQLRFSEQWTFTANGTPITDDLHDRPPFLLEATTSVGNGAPVAFAVMTNHLRSLGGIDDFVPEASDPTPTSDHENAHRIRRKKLNQAMAVACEAQAYQTAHPTTPLILVGDYNAFEFSDSYTDVTGIIRGDTNSAQSEYDIGFGAQTGGCTPQLNGQLVSPTFTEALFSLPANQRYSFVFNGNAQELDHAFLSTAAQQRYIGFAYGRGNADAPAREETQPLITLPTPTVLFASDHDGFVLRLDATGNRQPVGNNIANQSATEGDVVNRNVAASFSDPDSDPLICTATGLPAGLAISSSCVISGTINSGTATGSPYTVTVRATDPGGLFVELSFTLTVVPLPALIFSSGFE